MAAARVLPPHPFALSWPPLLATPALRLLSSPHHAHEVSQRCQQHRQIMARGASGGRGGGSGGDASDGRGSGGGGFVQVDAWLEAIQQQLEAVADQQVKAGQDAYLKSAIFHRGVKTPAVDAACKAFLTHTAPAAELATLRELGLALIRQPLQEDKLAGMVVWQHALLKGGLAEAQWRQELQELQRVYTDGHVFAWSTSDGICGRLLAPVIRLLLKGSTPEGQACSREVLGWCRHDDLWLRRSSVVAFASMARLPDEQVFPGFRAALLDSLATTVRGPEHFAQTGTGWVLRELGKGDAGQMLLFVEANLPHFSRKGLRYALEHQPPSVWQRLMAQHKVLQGEQGEGPAVARQVPGSSRQRRQQNEAEGPGDGGEEGGATAKRHRKRA